MSKMYADRSKPAVCSACGFYAASHHIRLKHALLFHGGMVLSTGEVRPLDADKLGPRQDELLWQLETCNPPVNWRVFGRPGQRPDHWGAAADAAHALPSSPVAASKGRGVTVEYLDCDLPAPGPVVRPGQHTPRGLEILQGRFPAPVLPTPVAPAPRPLMVSYSHRTMLLSGHFLTPAGIVVRPVCSTPVSLPWIFSDNIPPPPDFADAPE